MMNLNRLLPVRPNSTQQRQGLLYVDEQTEEAFVKGYVNLLNTYLKLGNPLVEDALHIMPSSRNRKKTKKKSPVNSKAQFINDPEIRFDFVIRRSLDTAIQEVLAHAIELFHYFGRVNSSSTLVSRIEHADLSPKTPDRLQAFVSAPLSASLTTQITPASLNEKGSSTSLFSTTELAGLGNAPKIWAQETPDSLIVPGKLAIQQELIASLGKLRLPSDSNPAGSRDVQLILSPVKKDETHGRVVEQFEAAKRALTQFWRDLAQPTQATFEQIGIEGA